MRERDTAKCFLDIPTTWPNWEDDGHDFSQPKALGHILEVNSPEWWKNIIIFSTQMAGDFEDPSWGSWGKLTDFTELGGSLVSLRFLAPYWSLTLIARSTGPLGVSGCGDRFRESQKGFGIQKRYLRVGEISVAWVIGRWGGQYQLSRTHIQYRPTPAGFIW